MTGHMGDRAAYLALVHQIARDAGLTSEQTRELRSAAASWAMENMPPTDYELRLGADITAGRTTFEHARRALGV